MIPSGSFKNDFRYHQLLLAFLPLLVWGCAIGTGTYFWKLPWGMPVAFFLAYAGGKLVERTPEFMYMLGRRALSSPLRGKAGEDFLLFELEPLNTVHKIKLVPEDAGFLYCENGNYRLTTLISDFTIPLEHFHYEPFVKDGAVKGLLFRFVPPGMQEPIEIAGICKYIGPDLNLSTDMRWRCEWASGAIERMVSAETHS